MIEERQHLIDIKNLKTQFKTKAGLVRAVDGVSLAIDTGEVLGLVGESGCGKSVTSFSIMRLVQEPGRIVDGEVLYRGRDILKLPEKELQGLRGRKISFILQQPQHSLNPIVSVGKQVGEVFKLHTDLSKQEIKDQVLDFFKQVGIPDPERKYEAFPHELSGGQAQRVMISMALALNPDLLIADEPTTALDVTIEAQILDLMRELIEKRNTAILMITHDMGVISEMADKVAVMYAGIIVESAEAAELFENALHPYTRGLLKAIPRMGYVKDRLDVIPGYLPNLTDLPPGCRFASRCEERKKSNIALCTEAEPDLTTVSLGHHVRCHLYSEKR